MKTGRKLDCVRLKDEIHALLAKEQRGLSAEAVRRRTRRKLATSRGPVARLWRSLARRSAKRVTG